MRCARMVRAHLMSSVASYRSVSAGRPAARGTRARLPRTRVPRAGRAGARTSSGSDAGGRARARDATDAAAALPARRGSEFHGAQRRVARALPRSPARRARAQAPGAVEDVRRLEQARAARGDGRPDPGLGAPAAPEVRIPDIVAPLVRRPAGRWHARHRAGRRGHAERVVRPGRRGARARAPRARRDRCEQPVVQRRPARQLARVARGRVGAAGSVPHAKQREVALPLADDDVPAAEQHVARDDGRSAPASLRLFTDTPPCSSSRFAAPFDAASPDATSSLSTSNRAGRRSSSAVARHLGERRLRASARARRRTAPRLGPPKRSADTCSAAASAASPCTRRVTSARERALRRALLRCATPSPRRAPRSRARRAA